MVVRSFYQLEISLINWINDVELYNLVNNWIRNVLQPMEVHQLNIIIQWMKSLLKFLYLICQFWDMWLATISLLNSKKINPQIIFQMSENLVTQIPWEEFLKSLHIFVESNPRLQVLAIPPKHLNSKPSIFFLK